MQYSTKEVSDHYSDPEVTKWYLGDSGLGGWHFPVRGDDDDNSVDRSTELIADRCALRPGQLVLDAGCGIGVVSHDIAERYGVKVTGISIVERHVQLARRIAALRGLAEQTRFECVDFMRLPFDDATFDAVINQETACYANDIEQYLVGVRRVLKKGGIWCSLDGYRSGLDSTEDTEKWHLDLQEGWKLPPLRHWRKVEDTLHTLGFQDVFVQDLSEMVKPYAQQFIQETDRKREEHKKGAEQVEGEMLKGHISAGYGACKGLFDGFFSYYLICGRVPA